MVSEELVEKCSLQMDPYSQRKTWQRQLCVSALQSRVISRGGAGCCTAAFRLSLPIFSAQCHKSGAIWGFCFLLFGLVWSQDESFLLYIDVAAVCKQWILSCS